MNVLISSGFRYWNAEAAYAAGLARLLRASGHGAWLLAPAESRNAEELAARGLEPLTDMLPARGGPLGWLAGSARLQGLYRRLEIDVVNVFPSAEWPLHLWAARRGERTARPIAVVRTRGGARPERRSWLNRRLYGQWSDGVIASCDLIRDRLRTGLHVPQERIATIYYPAPPLWKGNPAERAALRARLLHELALEPDQLAIAIVGRIAPEKGHELLLRAFTILRARLPRAALLIVNKAYPSEGPHRRRLEARIQSLGLEPHVRWLGFRTDVRDVMACADIGVIPSIASEMNCRVAVEFFSVGTPVVCFPTGALPEVVASGLSGLVSTERTAEALAEALLAVGTDAVLRQRLGEGARQQAQTRFDEKLFLRATLEAFSQAIQRRTRTDPIGRAQ